MDRVLIVGSGASGVHFARSVLEKGYQVTVLDVGYARPPAVNPQDSFEALKRNLSDPVEYFLGKDFEAVVHPGSEGEYYGFPPNKSYIFSRPGAFRWRAHGFAPLLSFAQGGLAETWTGGVYPLNEAELKDFPFDYDEIAPCYSEVARRIGISGTKDDLARFYPVHDHLLDPLRLDRHSARLLAAYERHRRYLNDELNCFMGRSRVATLTRDLDNRKECTHTGRCLWGCPSGALYTPSITLEQCQGHPNFQYIPQVYVSHFTFDGNRIRGVVVESLNGSGKREMTAERFVLAAGTLSSSRIFLESIRRATGEIIELRGLMDNRQILIPFLNLGMLGEQYDAEAYQYHQLAMGIEGEAPEEYLHGLITTLKTALVHPIVQNIPLDLRTAVKVFRNVRAGLGVLNLNFRDYRRDDNLVTLQAEEPSGEGTFVINYVPPVGEAAVMKRAVRLVKKALWKLGCIVPPGMMHVRPMGASAHYAGTIPMSRSRAPHTASAHCQSHDFENLYFVDGTTFPALPAKNFTFALMANAVRVAEHAF